MSQLDAPTMKFRMSDTLFTAVRAALDMGGARPLLVLYMPYGIVRGRISRTVTDTLSLARDARLENVSRVRIETDVIELDDCEVEHFQNHMPTAHFRKLYVRMDDVQSFAFDVKHNEVFPFEPEPLTP